MQRAHIWAGAPWRKAAPKRQRVEVHRDDAVLERPLERKAHQAVIEKLDVLGDDGRSQDLLAERLAARAIVSTDHCRGVERKPGDVQTRLEQGTGLAVQGDRQPIAPLWPSGSGPDRGGALVGFHLHHRLTDDLDLFSLDRVPFA